MLYTLTPDFVEGSCSGGSGETTLILGEGSCCWSKLICLFTGSLKKWGNEQHSSRVFGENEVNWSVCVVLHTTTYYCTRKNKKNTKENRSKELKVVRFSVVVDEFTRNEASYHTQRCHCFIASPVRGGRVKPRTYCSFSFSFTCYLYRWIRPELSNLVLFDVLLCACLLTCVPERLDRPGGVVGRLLPSLVELVELAAASN